MCLTVLGFSSLPNLSLLLPHVTWGRGRAWLGLARARLSYFTLFFEVFSFPHVGNLLCSVQVILLGLVVFAVFSCYMWFWEEISASVLILILPCFSSVTYS